MLDMSENVGSSIIVENGITYTPHAPIFIDGNADFAAQASGEGWQGDGNQGNPYIIQNYEINAQDTAHGIHINSTNVYFEINNCYIHNGSWTIFEKYHGIVLENVENGIIDDCVLYRNNYNVYLLESNNNSLKNNNITNGIWGVTLSQSNNINITNNNLSSNFYGIDIFSGNNNTIFNNQVQGGGGCNGGIVTGSYNTVSNNTVSEYLYAIVPDSFTHVMNNHVYSNFHGISLLGSDNNNVQIENNTVSDNSYGIFLFPPSNDNIIFNNSIFNNVYGIYFGTSGTNVNSNITIINNTIYSNTNYGVYLNSTNTSNSNWIYHNNFFYNKFQAHDDTGTNHWDNGYPSGGNYWSDYTGIDLNSTPTQDVPPSDGIGDTPFIEIDGGMGAQDNYPLMDSIPYQGPLLPPSMILLHPNGNEEVLSGVISITWEAADYESLPSGCIDLSYSDDAGASWIPIVNDIDNTGFYPWDIVAAGVQDGYSYMVKAEVVDTDLQTDSDQSSTCFSIDNLLNDRWYFQVESTNLGSFLDVDMKPCELIRQSINVDITDSGEFLLQTFASEYIAVEDVDLSGDWNFSVYAKSNSFVSDGYLYANVYADDGSTSSLLFTTDYDDEAVGEHLSYNEFWWQYSVPPGTLLHNGDHVVVELILHEIVGTTYLFHYHNSTSDIPINGTVIGDHTLTHDSDDTYEIINEIEVTSGPESLLDEDFSTGVPPIGWGEDDPTGNWNQVLTANAGGLSPEANFRYVEQIDTWRLYAGPLDTTGMSTLDLQWNNFFVDYGVGVTCKVQTSSDGTIWHDTGWFIDSGGGNYGPILEQFIISTSDVGSSSFYVSFTVEGDAYQLDDWYVDDVYIPLPDVDKTSLLEHKWMFDVPYDEEPYEFMVEASRNAGVDGDNFIFSYSTDDVSYTDMSFIVDSPSDAIYNHSLPTGLDGDVYIRVVDTDQNIGNVEISQLFIDRMFINSSEEVIPPEYRVTISFDYQETPSYVDPVIPFFPSPKYDVQVLPVPGWNFISYPLQIEGQIQDVLNDSAGDCSTMWDYIQWYDASDPIDHWKTYSTFKPPTLNDLLIVNNTIGLWVHITSVGDGFLTVQGPQPTITSINLKAGWNLVGYPSLIEKTISDALAGTEYDRVEGFNATAPYRISQLDDSYMMKPGEGYWIHVPADTVWILDW